MDMTWKWVPLIISIVQLLLVWAIWSMRKEFVRQTDCAAHKKEQSDCLTTLAARVTNAEADICNMPQPAAWSKMQVAIEEVRGSNRALLAKLEGQNELLKRIEHPMQLLIEHHLRGDK
jgi:hypothetical protein